MSENLDLVHSVYGAWERGDFTKGVDWADPDIELVFVDGPEPGTWRGLTDMTAHWRQFATAWKDWRILAQEYRELAHDRVLVLVRFAGSGTTSKLDMSQLGDGTHVWHVRDGKATRMVVYFDRDRAFADLGLEE
jgi:ketosteroid isomerase-like protein